MNTNGQQAATNTITDSKGRTRRHSGRFNMAAIKRELAAKHAPKAPTTAAANLGHWLEVGS